MENDCFEPPKHLQPKSKRAISNRRAPGLLRTRKSDRLLGIKGVSLHSYLYAWAERAKCAGYPERFAQEALGHNSKAVLRAFAKKAQVKFPSLEDSEAAAVQGKMIAPEFPQPFAVVQVA